MSALSVNDILEVAEGWKTTVVHCRHKYKYMLSISVGPIM